jgi:2,4-dienoyl-CoA reductase-like NADH-dependent reductase (Old Yellow Enzyme family)
MSLLFSEYQLQSPQGPLRLPNRVVVAPMCQYSAHEGEASDWHLMHWGNLLNSGAGLFMIEATAVSPEGRITPYCLGLWDQKTQTALEDKLVRARKLAPQTSVFIQLAHAGRKASSAAPWQGGQILPSENGGWETQAPSAIPQLEGERAPHQLSTAEMQAIIQNFVESAHRAKKIGIDGIELHAAHGYLLHQFLSPIANQRQDQYGGSLENRMRFMLELFSAVRKEWGGVLGVRLSASDWLEHGWGLPDSVELTLRLKQLGCDYIHVSSGGISPKQQIKLGPNYQVPFAKEIKQKTGMTTMAVGLITEPLQAEEILQNQEADLIALARAFLYKPRWGWEAAAALQGHVSASPQYWRCLPREAQAVFADVKMGQR